MRLLNVLSINRSLEKLSAGNFSENSDLSLHSSALGNALVAPKGANNG